MIYVRIEIWPGGCKARARLLSEALIANTGGDATTGEYSAQFSKVGGFKASEVDLSRCTVKNVLRSVHVGDFPRKRLYAHDLLLRALRAAFGSRNPTPCVDLSDT